MTEDLRKPGCVLIAALLAAIPATVAPAAELIGRFMDAGGNYEIPYAELELCPAGGGDCMQTTTDASGAFVFRDVAPGAYVVRVPGKAGPTERPITIGSEREIMRIFAD